MSNGQLILVSTPIGNLGDLSPRMLEALRDADIILCEDTRHTRKLLSHAGITDKKLVAAHEHNEASKVPELLRYLEEGQNVALASDAGVPAIADPGRRLVDAALEAGYAVSIIPGPNAAVSALAISGMPSEQFFYAGFLAAKGSKRNKLLRDIAESKHTIVLYESPHRLPRTLGDLISALGPERQTAVIRELTKLHEEVWRGTLAEAIEHFAKPRGEFTLVISAPSLRGE